jgi:hypothetical protein
LIYRKPKHGFKKIKIKFLKQATSIFHERRKVHGEEDGRRILLGDDKGRRDGQAAADQVAV